MLRRSRPTGMELLPPLRQAAAHRQVLEERARASGRPTRCQLQDAHGEEEAAEDEDGVVQEGGSSPDPVRVPRARWSVYLCQGVEEGEQEADAVGCSEDPVCCPMLEGPRGPQETEDVLERDVSTATGKGDGHPLQRRQEDTGSRAHEVRATCVASSAAGKAAGGGGSPAGPGVSRTRGTKRMWQEEDGEEVGGGSDPAVRVPRASGEADAEDGDRPVDKDSRLEGAEEKTAGRCLYPACLLRSRRPADVCGASRRNHHLAREERVAAGAVPEAVGRRCHRPEGRWEEEARDPPPHHRSQPAAGPRETFAHHAQV
mmetsp:Transcript_26548/g.60563  ORF Transcript_26548/g.60563 Transcript_26548/m.60563 type:complete len:315 (+) Transcript_26548:1588-2532(+)